MLPFDKIVEHSRLHRTGPVEGEYRDEVFEVARFELGVELLHTARFDLEHTDRFAFLNRLVDFRVIHRHIVEVDADLVALFDQFDGIVDDRQRLEPKEVEFDQVDIFEEVERILRYQCLFARWFVERRLVPELFVGYDDTRGMHTGIAFEPFKGKSEFPDAGRRGVGFDQFPELRLFLECTRLESVGPLFPLPVKGDSQFVGNQFRHLVRFCVTDTKHPRDVTDNPLCQKRTERDNLGHVETSIFLDHVVDDLSATRLAEIHIDIGHADALRIQKTLEEQIVFHRVDIGDAQRIGDEASSRRSPSGSDRNLPLFRFTHEIPDDQHIAGKLHLVDDLHLRLQSRPILVVMRRIHKFETLFQPFAAFVDKEGFVVGKTVLGIRLGHFQADIGGILPGKFEIGRRRIAQIELQIALVGDLLRMFECLGNVGIEFRHLFG